MQQERDQLAENILHEMSQHGTEQWILAGDFNENPYQSKLLAHLCTTKGWRIPTLVDTTGCPTEITFRGKSTSWLDTVAYAPEVGRKVACMVAHHEYTTSHAPLSVAFMCIPIVDYPKVWYPPRLLLTLQGQPRDWTGLIDIEQRCLSLLSHGASQSQMDELWDMWEQELRRFLGSQGKAEEGRDVRRIGMPPPPSQRQHVQHVRNHVTTPQVKTCMRAVHRLSQADTPMSPRMWAKFLDDADCLMQHLRLSRYEFERARLVPKAVYPHWKQLLSLLQNRTNSEVMSCWKKSLSEKNRPTPAVFQWLKGRPPQAPLAVQSDAGIVSGPQDFFDALRGFWAGIMCRDHNEVTELRDWMDTFPRAAEAGNDQWQLLQTAGRSMKKGTAAGLDGWPVEIGASPCLRSHLFHA